jgi:hypothetical protein
MGVPEKYLRRQTRNILLFLENKDLALKGSTTNSKIKRASYGAVLVT